MFIWGQNGSGQLGDGANNNSDTPISVSSLGIGVTAISVGYKHTCVLSTTGEVQCWGKMVPGQIGDGSFVDKNSPVSVNRLGNNIIT